MTNSSRFDIAALATLALTANANRSMKEHVLCSNHLDCVKRLQEGKSYGPEDKTLGISIALAVAIGEYRNPQLMTPKKRNQLELGAAQPLTVTLSHGSQGLVYFEGIPVERFSFGDTESGLVREGAAFAWLMKLCVRRLSQKCVINGKTATSSQLEEAPLDMKWHAGLTACYSSFEKNGQVACIFRKRDKTGAIAVHTSPSGERTTTEHSDAFEAHREYRILGWKCLPQDSEYKEMCRHFDLLGLTDEQIGELTGYQYLTE